MTCTPTWTWLSITEELGSIRVIRVIRVIRAMRVIRMNRMIRVLELYIIQNPK